MSGRISLRVVRRLRGRLLTLTVLAAIAAGLLDLGFLLADRFPSRLQAVGTELHAPHVHLVVFSDSLVGEVTHALAADPQVSRLEAEPVRTEFADVRFGRGGSLSATYLYFDLDTPVALGQRRVLARASPLPADAVFIPESMRAAGGYALGDRLIVRTPTVSRSFTVAGVFENPYQGSVRLGVLGFGLPHSAFVALGSGRDAPAEATLLKADLVDPAKADDVATADALGLGSDDQIATGTWPQLLKLGVVGAVSYAVIVVAFAASIVFLLLAVTHFLIKATLAQDVAAFGVLGAMGATTGQIAVALALPFMAAAALGSLLGLGASYAAIPALAELLSAQSGIVWRPVPEPEAALAPAALTGLVTATSLLTAAGVRRMTPVDALRDGHTAHEFSIDLIPLGLARGRPDVALGLKQALAYPAQTVTVLIAVALTVFVGTFSVALATNLLGDPDEFNTLTLGSPDDLTLLVAHTGDPEEVLNRTRLTDGVGRAFFMDLTFGRVGGDLVGVRSTEDFSVNTYAVARVGRDPKFSNEVSMGAVLAQRVGRRIGDEVEVSIGRRTETFVITGLLSTSENAGAQLNLTTAGRQRLDPAFVPRTISVHVSPNADRSAVMDRLRAANGDDLTQVRDMRGLINDAQEIYRAVTRLLAIVIVVVSGIVLALVVGLTVRTLLIRARRSMVIQASLGYTRGQLLSETLWTFLPALLAGAALGVLLGELFMGGLLGVLLWYSGIVDQNFGLDPGLLAALAVGVIGVAVASLVVSSLDLRRIESAPKA